MVPIDAVRLVNGPSSMVDGAGRYSSICHLFQRYAVLATQWLTVPTESHISTLVQRVQLMIDVSGVKPEHYWSLVCLCDKSTLGWIVFTLFSIFAFG